jgi:hypothetical protein
MVNTPQPGLYAAARRVLLDALEALEDHLDSIVLVGAQAVYLRAGESTVIADPPYTTDGDLSIDPRSLADQPLLAERLRAADFHPARERDESRVGTWEKLVLAGSVPNLAEDAVVGVDLLVPEAVSGAGRRGARLGVHGKDVAAKSPGLEAALVDHTVELLTAFEEQDPRVYEIRVAGPAALLVAKAHKVADRIADAERGRVDRLGAARTCSTSSGSTRPRTSTSSPLRSAGAWRTRSRRLRPGGPSSTSGGSSTPMTAPLWPTSLSSRPPSLRRIFARSSSVTRRLCCARLRLTSSQYGKHLKDAPCFTNGIAHADEAQIPKLAHRAPVTARSASAQRTGRRIG